MQNDLKNTIELLLEAQLQLSTEDIVKAGIDNHTACKFNGNLLSFYAVLDSDNREKLLNFIFKDIKRLQEIANELKEDAEKILGCDLVLIQTSISSSDNRFFPVAKIIDKTIRQIDNEKFVSFNGKKGFSKKIGKFQYFLEIEGLIIEHPSLKDKNGKFKFIY